MRWQNNIIKIHGSAILNTKRESIIAHNLGIELKNQGKLVEAIAAFSKSIKLNPDYPAAYNNLGIILRTQGHLEEAIFFCLKALELNPNDANVHNNLGNVFTDQGKLQKAVICYNKALALDPDHTHTHNNLGNVLVDLGKLEKAATSFYKALELNPNDANVHNNLGNALLAQGKLHEAIASYSKALELNPNDTLSHSNLLYALHYDPKRERMVIFNEHKSWNERHAALLTAAANPHTNDPNPDRQLRIGLVSGGFRGHPVGFFLASVLEIYDKSKVEIFAYSNNPHNDFLTKRIHAAVDTWRFIVGLSDEAVAELIRDDRIDILIDLTGHGSDPRLLVFARKPAPIQAKWIGCQLNTTGMEAIDYFITDEVETPLGDEKWFIEQILRLPNVYTCYTPPDYAPDVIPLPAFDRGYVTFGCYNKLAKLNPNVIKVWSELMRRVLDSRLILKYRQFDDEDVCKRFYSMFKKNGIASDRIDLLGHSGHDKHLAMYNQIDIALDPFPYNGCLSTCEALWMGVPVVTIPGEIFTERHSATFLTAVGLTDWIVETPHDYVALVEYWCNDLGKLAELRKGLRARVEASPLCDYSTFARNLENSYRDIWQKWCEEDRLN